MTPNICQSSAELRPNSHMLPSWTEPNIRPNSLAELRRLPNFGPSLLCKYCRIEGWHMWLKYSVWMNSVWSMKTHFTPLSACPSFSKLQRCGWYTYSTWYCWSVLCFLLCCIYYIHGPAYFKHICTPASDISDRAHLRSAERRDMLVPRTRTELGQRTVWNSLPTHLRSTQTV